MSKRAGTSKWVTPCDPGFGEEVIGHLQEGLSDVESENDLQLKVTTSGNVLRQSDKIKKFYPLQIFTQTNILIVSSCIILKHNMNYQNVSLCSDF
jgi:hypothetical protein